MRGLLTAAIVLVGVAVPVAAGAQSRGALTTITLPRAPEHSVLVRPVLPAWVAMPTTARILTSDGLEMRPMRNSAVTWENARIGVLVGALNNAGSCARHVRAFLQYTDHQWRPLGEPIESEARVSQVEPGGALPYRFRLKRTADFAVLPSGYILQVVEDGKPVADTLQWVSTTRTTDVAPCGRPPVAIDTVVTQSRATLRGYRISGTLTVTAGGPVRPDAVTLTALLRDDGGDVLEVLTGVPVVRDRDLPTGVIENGQTLSFSLATDVPLGKAVSSTTVFVDVLGDPSGPAGGQ
jgi:hypothetical protein